MIKVSPRAALWSFATLLVVSAAYVGLWFYVAVSLRQQAEIWLEARRQDGLTITHGTLAIAGFPGRAELVLPDFMAAAFAADGTRLFWSWRAPTLRVAVRPYAFNTIAVDFSGSEITVNPRLPEAPPLLVIEKARLEITRVELTRAGQPAGGARLSLDIGDMSLSDVLPGTPARTMRHARVTVDVRGSFAPGPVPEALEAWRVGGGTLEVRDFNVDWPPVSATGSGTVALDRALQPIGSFTAKFRGFLQVVDMLVAAGRMATEEASLARGALSLLAKVPSEGGEPELDIALTLQDRKVYAGPVIVMEIPLLTWRKPSAAP